MSAKTSSPPNCLSPDGATAPLAQSAAPETAASSHQTAIRWLTVAALALAAALTSVKLWPQRCDACGGWEFRARAVRLAPGWRMFCPNAPIQGQAPRLCRRCFEALLKMTPAHDEESRRVVAHYLTAPDFDTSVKQSIDAGMDKARERQKRPPIETAPSGQ